MIANPSELWNQVIKAKYKGNEEDWQKNFKGERALYYGETYPRFGKWWFSE